MSTDWDAVCFTCCTYTHLGQRFTSGPSFGYGSNDAQGRLDAAQFISDHIGHHLQIMLDAPDGFTKHEPPAASSHVDPGLWGLHDGRKWLSLHAFNDNAESDAPMLFFSEASAAAFRAGVHKSYVVKPFDRIDWEKHNT